MKLRFNYFKNWNLFPKILSISVISIVLFCSGIFFYIIPRVEMKLIDEKKESTEHTVELAVTLINQFEDQVEKGELSLEAAQSTALRRIQGIRYNGDNYIWINDSQHRMVMHPIKPELNGKDMADFKDPNGTYLFKEFVNVCKKQGAGFVDYLWPKPGFDKPVPKVS